MSVWRLRRKDIFAPVNTNTSVQTPKVQIDFLTNSDDGQPHSRLLEILSEALSMN
jgi:hypothetical protein